MWLDGRHDVAVRMLVLDVFKVAGVAVAWCACEERRGLGVRREDASSRRIVCSPAVWKRYEGSWMCTFQRNQTDAYERCGRV